MNTRNKPRIDYKVLASTGKKVEKEIDIENLNQLVSTWSLSETMSTDDKLKELIINVSIVNEEIDDFMEENDMDEVSMCITDINEIIDKIEKLRSS